MISEDDRRITTTELAERWGFTPQMIRRLKKSGAGPAYNEALKGYMLSSIVEFEGGGLLTKEQLADRWGIGIRALEKREAKGCAPEKTKLGHFARYRLNDIVAFEQQTSK